MKVNDILSSLNDKSDELDTKQFKNFILFCQNELKLDNLPAINWLKNNTEPSFGLFNDEDETIDVVINNRHPLDIMRTLAHELCHYKQLGKDELNHKSGNTGSKQENEANAIAGIIMRRWNKRHPEMFEARK